MGHSVPARPIASRPLSHPSAARARASGPCPDCTASGHACDDHACDLQLIAAYQQTAIAAILDVSRRIDAGLADHDRGIFSAATTEKIR
jgi:hypothetical protein